MKVYAVRYTDCYHENSGNIKMVFDTYRKSLDYVEKKAKGFVEIRHDCFFKGMEAYYINIYEVK